MANLKRKKRTLVDSDPPPPKKKQQQQQQQQQPFFFFNICNKYFWATLKTVIFDTMKCKWYQALKLHFRVTLYDLQNGNVYTEKRTLISAWPYCCKNMPNKRALLRFEIKVRIFLGYVNNKIWKGYIQVLLWTSKLRIFEIAWYAFEAIGKLLSFEPLARSALKFRWWSNPIFLHLFHKETLQLFR